MRRLLLGVAIAAVAAGCGSGHSAAPPPHGVYPETAAVLGVGDSWVLGDYRCRAGFCSALLRSVDAGRHFTSLVAPPLPSQGTDPTLEFASEHDGFAYVKEESPLFATHDGGASWHRAGPGGYVRTFAVGGGYVYAVIGSFGLWRSPVSRNDWHRLRLPPYDSRYPLSLAARGSDVWVAVTSPRYHPENREVLARSTDRGDTFTTGHVCLAQFESSIVPAGGGVVWAVCPTGMTAGLWRSTDAGRSWAAFSAEARPLLLPNSALVAASTPRNAVLARADGPLLHTTDAGLHWTTVKGTARVTDAFWLRFATARVGAAVVQVRGRRLTNAFMRTTDGGATWKPVPLP